MDVAAATMDLAVTGMTCAMCQKNVERALGRVDGVLEATVNLANDSASCDLFAGAGKAWRLCARAGKGWLWRH